jgi:hypothetical protein
MADPKKGLAALIVAKTKPVEAPAPEAHEEMDEYHAAAEEIIEAMKSGDASALAESLKSFVEMCSSAPEQTEE